MNPAEGYPPPVRGCKVCGGSAPLEGVADFNKNCEALRGRRTGLSGVPVYYRRCGDCGFLFTTFFDGWGPADFRRHIYNAEYARVDPEYEQERPARNAAIVGRVFRDQAARLRVLDYGGGNGGFVAAMRGQGFDIRGVDPFDGDGADEALGPYDLITCFEVVEHVTDPHGLVDEIVRRMAPDGLALFSTVLQPEDRAAGSLEWWYVAPRNGHVSLHTPDSLARVWARAGMRVATVNHGVHVACRAVPDWAAHVQVVLPTGRITLAEMLAEVPAGRPALV